MKTQKFHALLVTILLVTACSQTPTDQQTPEDSEVTTKVSQPLGQDQPGETGDLLEPGNFTGLPLTIPEGMRLDYLVEDLSGARDIEGPDAQGNYWVSRMRNGVISKIELDGEGNASQVDHVFKGLNQPHGLAFDPQNPSLLYYAEVDKVSKVDISGEFLPKKLIDLPREGRHFTRSLLFGRDDRLYISIGSSCDVCEEKDERYATIYSMGKDGSDFKLEAQGLRNAVFMATNPITGDIWVTEMGRDRLGDDLPPDEINILGQGDHYGWPYCYGQNVKDEEFKNEEGCEDKIPSYIDLQAHSAPLGLAFVPEEGWPEAYWNDLLVAYHGSWNRTVPTGYKIMHIELDDEGNEVSRGAFVEGWLAENGDVFGRPVDVEVLPGGTMYITDDHKGAVYRLRWMGES